MPYLLNSFNQEVGETYLETSLRSFDPSLFKSWPPRGRIGPQRGIKVLHIFKVLFFVAQVGDVTPVPLMSWWYFGV